MHNMRNEACKWAYNLPKVGAVNEFLTDILTKCNVAPITQECTTRYKHAFTLDLLTVIARYCVERSFFLDACCISNEDYISIPGILSSCSCQRRLRSLCSSYVFQELAGSASGASCVCKVYANLNGFHHEVIQYQLECRIAWEHG